MIRTGKRDEALMPVRAPSNLICGVRNPTVPWGCARCKRFQIKRATELSALRSESLFVTKTPAALTLCSSKSSP